MNRNFYKKMKNYKEIKGFIQNVYICIADILPLWNDIRIANMNELGGHCHAEWSGNNNRNPWRYRISYEDTYIYLSI